MRRTRINPIGRQGKLNAQVATVQYAAFSEIAWCELCGKTGTQKHMAHYRKRSKGLSYDELLYGVAYLCDEPCHGELDRGPAVVMADTILGIIEHRESEGEFFTRARALAREILNRRAE